MPPLHAAAATIDITPPADTWMTGFADRVGPSTGSHDPLNARALLLQSGAARLAVVSCDLLGLSPLDDPDGRAEKCSCKIEEIMASILLVNFRACLLDFVAQISK